MDIPIVVCVGDGDGLILRAIAVGMTYEGGLEVVVNLYEVSEMGAITHEPTILRLG